MTTNKQPTQSNNESGLTKYRVAVALLLTLCMITAAYYEIRLMFKSDLAELTKRHSVAINKLETDNILLAQRLSDSEQRNRQLQDRVEQLHQQHQRNYQQLWEQLNNRPVRRL